MRLASGVEAATQLEAAVAVDEAVFAIELRPVDDLVVANIPGRAVRAQQPRGQLDREDLGWIAEQADRELDPTVEGTSGACGLLRVPL